MTSLALAIAPDLVFEFRDIDERLLEKIVTFLDYYPVAENLSGALVVSADRPPAGRLDRAQAQVVLEEDDLLVRKSGHLTLFELPSGVSALIELKACLTCDWPSCSSRPSTNRYRW